MEDTQHCQGYRVSMIGYELDRGEWILPVITNYCRRVLLWRHIYTLSRGAFCSSQFPLEVCTESTTCHWAPTDHLGSRLHIRYDAFLRKAFRGHPSRRLFRSTNRVVQNLVIVRVQSGFWRSLCATGIRIAFTFLSRGKSSPR